MSRTFNRQRLVLARKRRRLSGKDLGAAASVSAITVSRLENGENEPDEQTVRRIAAALGYPLDFFFADDPDLLDTSAVSFRSLTKMSAKERDAAISAGVLGLELSDWLEQRFALPATNLIDLSYESDPDAAARDVRAHWGLGERPIGNMLGLLEVHGVRVFSLSEATRTVDAFSFWRDDRPFVFVNNFKTSEHAIFDLAHELGHLVMHRHAGAQSSREAEREANRFASALLMPEDDVRSRVPRFITVDVILKAKARWRVSAMAMANRLHTLGFLTDWQYKSACIELGRRGFRTGEPGGLDREISTVWKKVLSQLWQERVTKREIAEQMHIPADELEALIWGLAGPIERPQGGSAPTLRAV